MEYEVVNLEEKLVAGLRIRTGNSDPNMTKLIGEAWEKFFANGIYQSIPDKTNDKCIGLYTNYENGVMGSYDMMVCCETSSSSGLPEGIFIQTIPSGNYAKFIVRGDVHIAVAEFWTKLWNMDLDRKYSCDFEEYQGDSDMTNSEIHIYIALN